MSILNNKDGMRPVLIIPPEEVSAEDIARLNENGFCTIVAKDPSKIKFLDPIPSVMDRTKAENAAIRFSRKILLKSGGGKYVSAWDRSEIVELMLECLVEGTPLDRESDAMECIFDNEKSNEMVRLAHAEAKAEREAKKQKVVKVDKI